MLVVYIFCFVLFCCIYFIGPLFVKYKIYLGLYVYVEAIRNYFLVLTRGER